MSIDDIWRFASELHDKHGSHAKRAALLRAASAGRRGELHRKEDWLAVAARTKIIADLHGSN